MKSDVVTPSPQTEGLTVSLMQQMVHQLIDQPGEGYWSDVAIVLQNFEELGEISQSLRQYSTDQRDETMLALITGFAEGMRNTPDRKRYLGRRKKRTPGFLAEEIMDQLFSLICLANKHGVNLEQEFFRMMDKMAKRAQERAKRRKSEERGEMDDSKDLS